MSSNHHNDTQEAERRYKVARRVPYDRGYAWVVVFGAFMIMTIMAGVFKSGAIFFVQIKGVFGASNASITLIFGLANLVSLITALPARTIVEKIGTRNSTMVGSFLIALSYILSSFATNFYVLYLTLGICCGLGCALVFSPALVLVCIYFKKYRAIASALTVSGNAIGGLVVPPVINALIDSFGLSGSFLLTGGLSLNAMIFSSLLLPLKFWTPSIKPKQCNSPACKNASHQSAELVRAQQNEKKAEEQLFMQINRSLLHISDWNVTSISPQHEALAKFDRSNHEAARNDFTAKANTWKSEGDLCKRRTQSIDVNTDFEAKGGSITGRNGLQCFTAKQLRKTRSLSVTADSTEIDATKVPHNTVASTDQLNVEENGADGEESEPQSPSKLNMRKVALELLRNPLYVTLAVCYSLFTESYKTMIICITAYLMSMGYTRSQTLEFLVCLYLCDLCGRLSCIGLSMVIDRQRSRLFTKRHGYIMYVHCNAVALMGLSFAGSDRFGLLVALGLVGATAGLGIASHAVVLAENCKVKIEDLGIAHSLSMFIQAVFTIIISYSLGALADALGTWRWSLFLCAVLGHFGALVANYDVYLRLFRWIFCRSRRDVDVKLSLANSGL